MLKFTDHDAPVVFAHSGTDELYSPAGGWDATSRERQAGVRDANLETRGVLTAEAITDEDLRAGKYQEARVVELLVDWRTPFAGAFQTSIYFIAGITYTNETWQAQLSGQPAWLRKEVGTVLSRLCRYSVGHDRCALGVSLDSIKTPDVAVTSVQEGRRVFTASSLTQAAGTFTYGEFLWLTGANAGIRTEVLDHAAGGKLSLSLELPYDVHPGDEFDIWKGCDRLLDTCGSKFNNVVNFGGFPAIIGTDRMIGPAKDKTKTFA